MGTHGAVDPASPVYDDVIADFAKGDPSLAERLRNGLRQRLTMASNARPSRYQDSSTYSILTMLANEG